MFIAEYSRNLEYLARNYIGSYLEIGSKELLLEKATSLSSSVRKARKHSPTQWEFSILRERPVTFKQNINKLQVDISTTMQGQDDSVEDIRTVLRVWCWDKNMSYRKGIDGSAVENKFDATGKRVLVRYHFERRSQKVKKPEPIYHLQVGGHALEDENCWFPKKLDIPRFHFPPMDIVLLCELVLVDFFPEESENLRKNPEWRSLVIKSQEYFQRRYLDNFHTYLSKESKSNTLLGHLLS